MTDRDLFYCTDFQCDGHARSNETCLDPETLLPIPGCKPECSHPHCDYDPEVDGQHRHPDMPAAPKYTVSGNHLRITRLDGEGNPTGPVMDLSNWGEVSLDVEAGSADDAALSYPYPGETEFTLDIALCEVDPALLALLTGQGVLPEEVEFMYLRHPWYKRLLWWARGMWPWRTER